MNRTLRLIVFILATVLIAAIFPLPAADPATSKDEQLYTCGMHPKVIQRGPGNCPICGMKLTPLRRQATVSTGERKIKIYKSTMMPGELSPVPKKDSMGMDMV